MPSPGSRGSITEGSCYGSGDAVVVVAGGAAAACVLPEQDVLLRPERDTVPTKGIPKHRDTRFPRSPQPNDIVFNVVTVSNAASRFDGLRAMPELKLRPILTRPAAGAAKEVDGEEQASGSGSASPTARAWRRRLQESLVVVKESADPEEDFLESMAEMIAATDDVRASPRGLE